MSKAVGPLCEGVEEARERRLPPRELPRMSTLTRPCSMSFFSFKASSLMMPPGVSGSARSHRMMRPREQFNQCALCDWQKWANGGSEKGGMVNVCGQRQRHSEMVSNSFDTVIILLFSRASCSTRFSPSIFILQVLLIPCFIASFILA